MGTNGNEVKAFGRAYRKTPNEFLLKCLTKKNTQNADGQNTEKKKGDSSALRIRNTFEYGNGTIVYNE